MNSDDTRLTVADVGRMELIFIQLAYDQMNEMLNLDFFKNNDSLHVQRLLVRDAFNDAYKALKRSIVLTMGKEEFDNIMSMMADTADELEKNVNVVRSCFLTQCSMKIKYDEQKPMAQILCLETMLKLADGVCKTVIPDGNRRMQKVLMELEKLCDIQPIHILNGNILEFDNTATNKAVTSLINKVQNLSKQYTYGN